MKIIDSIKQKFADFKIAAKQKARKSLKYVVALIIVVALAGYFLIAFKNHSVPTSSFQVEKKSEVRGVTFSQVNRELLQRELKAGWMANDKIHPNVILDNRPNFQLGVLEVVRRNTYRLRENLSRMRTTDRIDPDLDSAFFLLNNDATTWVYPAPEFQYHKALKKMKSYEENLGTGKSSFYPRSDNLIQLLEEYLSIMGGVNTRLMNAPKDVKVKLSEETAGDTATKGEKPVDVSVPWLEVDNNFFFAKGVAYAVRHSLAAVKVDFAKVIEDKNSTELVDSIIADLDRCISIDPIYVFNGNPGGMLPNQSLNLNAPLNDARQKMNSLVSALIRG